MTCENCEQKITRALLVIPEITEVTVNSASGTAEISMSSHVQTEVMQNTLVPLGNYTITMDTETSIKQVVKTSHIKDLIPLFVIVGIILMFSIVVSLVQGQNFAFGMRMFMGGFFVVFGVLKLMKLKDFAIAYREYDLMAKQSWAYAYTYPFIELALGILYFTNSIPIATNIMTIVVMGIGALGVYFKRKKKEEIPCACLGTVFKVPMTWVTMVEDLLMVFMAIIMLLLF